MTGHIPGKRSPVILLALAAAFLVTASALALGHAGPARPAQGSAGQHVGWQAQAPAPEEPGQLVRRRDDEKAARDERPKRGEPARYEMRQKLVSIGDDFWIRNDKKERVFKVDGKALRLRETLVIEDAKGRELCEIQAKLLTIRDSMEIKAPGGRRLALVQKALISPLRDRLTAQITGGPDLEIKGNLLDFSYKITQNGAPVAEVSKKLISLTDAYRVEIQPGQNDALILAITVVIDMMVHD